MTDNEAAGVIRTPDQRLRVFVSSTLAELAPERAAVARAIEALRLTPVMFELGARPHPPREPYRAYLAQSDVFVGLYWQRYGWIGPGMDISGSGGRVPTVCRDATVALHEVAGPRAGAEVGGDDRRPAVRRRRLLPIIPHPRELGRLVRDDLALLLSERFTTPVVPAAAPASAEIRLSRRSLPTPPTSLHGRDDDIEALTSLLQAPDTRLVTLTGPGGIGKTRLAIAVGTSSTSQIGVRSS